MEAMNQSQSGGSTFVLKHAAVRQNRTYDYIYDKNYHLSSNIDHARQTFQIKSGPEQIKAIPIYKTMFSELKHNPRFQLQLKQSDVVPSHVSQDWPGKSNFQREAIILEKLKTGNHNILIPPYTTDYVDVGGVDRYRFSRRPIIPFIHTVPPYVVLDTSRMQALELKKQKELQNRPQTPFSRTIAIQTDYRDGEAQTDPYTPEYVVKPGCQPELLTLATLAYGRGLPAGLAEVEMIERARAKRAWEKTLPPINDPSQWEKRLKMMTEMERNEWLLREREIEKLQELRMEILKKMLKDREENQASILAKRLDRLWAKKQKEKEKRIKKLRIDHVKVIRKLVKKRENVDGSHKGRNVIDDYTNFGSDSYAPVTRFGYFPDKNADNYQVRSKYLDTFEGLLELEASLPQSVLQVQIKPPKRITTTKDGYMKRKYRDERELASIQEGIIEERKKAHEEEKPLRFLQLIEKPIPRPPTPRIEVPDEESERKELAVIFLQKLIRGKAVQNMMHSGKEEKLVLIKEVASTHALQAADIENARQFKQQVIALQRQRRIHDTKDSFVDEVLQSLEGDTVSNMLDFLGKELIRLQEERRIHAFAMLAERERRMREAEESGWRQVEERRRREEDEIFKQLLKTQQSSVETYLEDCILESINKVASDKARDEIKEMTVKINELAYELEDKQTSLEKEEIVADLVHNFLIPETQKQVVRQQLKDKQQPYLIAAHKELYNETKEILENEKNESK